MVGGMVLSVALCINHYLSNSIPEMCRSICNFSLIEADLSTCFTEDLGIYTTSSQQFKSKIISQTISLVK